MALKIYTNPLEDDPFLYLEKSEVRESFLFDCGLRVRGNYRKIRRLWGIFVTHAHIDHLIGFDHIIRSLLSDDLRMRIYGPPGILSKVAGKLAAYDWDRAFDQHLVIQVFELQREQTLVQEFICRKRFQPEPLVTSATTNIIRETEDDELSFAFGDHGGSPCLAYAYRVRDRWKVRKEGIAELGLRDGPWVGKLLAWRKNSEPAAVVGPATAATENFGIRPPEDHAAEKTEASATTTLVSAATSMPLIDVWGQSFPARELADKLLFTSAGHKVAYVTDTRLGDDVRPEMLKLAAHADILVAEATFLAEDRALAEQFHHLTAGETAAFAAEAGVKRLLLNHPSRRYHGTYRRLLKEAREIFPATDIIPYRGASCSL